jgi:hypothetical protein
MISKAGIKVHKRESKIGSAVTRAEFRGFGDDKGRTLILVTPK